MSTRSRFLQQYVLPAGLLLWLSCAQGTETASSFFGAVKIEVIDAVAGLKEFKITINRVEFHRSGASADLEWSNVMDASKEFNLLELRNGFRLPLTNKAVAVGSYEKIRVVFGAITVRKADDVERPVTLGPSAANGFVIDFGFSIIEDQTYQLIFDFDAARSVKEVSLNQFVFSPIIRVQPTLQSGSISGSISPPGAAALVMTTVKGDSISTYADTSAANGSFQLFALPPAMYDLRIVPGNGSYHETTVTAILVRAQIDTSIGQIILR